jgi:hypothetical protein
MLPVEVVARVEKSLKVVLVASVTPDVLRMPEGSVTAAPFAPSVRAASPTYTVIVVLRTPPVEAKVVRSSPAPVCKVMVYTPRTLGVQSAPPEVVKVPVTLVSAAAPVGVFAAFRGIGVLTPIPRALEKTPPEAVNSTLFPVAAPV